MPDTEILPTAPEAIENPATQPEIPPHHDTPPENANAGQGSSFEKFRDLGSKIFHSSTGQVFKKGRGRPRKDGAPGAADIPLDPPQAPQPFPVAFPADAPPAVNPDLVRRSVSAVVRSAFGFIGNKLRKKALIKSGDEKFAAKLAGECAVTEDEVSALSELAEICLKKYGVGTEYMPEVGLAAHVAAIAIRYQSAFADLEKFKDSEAKEITG